MSSTRKLNETLKNKNAFNHIEPNNLLLIGPMGCEVRAADIKNKAKNSIENKNALDVAIRYFQSKRGEKEAFEDIVVGVIVLSLAVKFARSPETILLSLIFLLCMPLKIGIALSYRGTKINCSDWLEDKFGQNKFEEIKKFEFDRTCLEKSIPQQHKNDSPSFEIKNKNINSFCDFRNKQKQNIKIKSISDEEMANSVFGLGNKAIISSRSL